jgi:hypothetical protein
MPKVCHYPRPVSVRVSEAVNDRIEAARRALGLSRATYLRGVWSGQYLPPITPKQARALLEDMARLSEEGLDGFPPPSA